MTRQGVGPPVKVRVADAVRLRATRTDLHEVPIELEANRRQRRRGRAQSPPLHAQVGRRRSALAAQTKSLSVRPSILWVQIFRRTLPQVRKISG